MRIPSLLGTPMDCAPYEGVDFLGLDVIQPVHRVLDLPLVRSSIHDEDLQCHADSLSHLQETICYIGSNRDVLELIGELKIEAV